MRVLATIARCAKAAYAMILHYAAPPFCLQCLCMLPRDTVFCCECASDIKPIVSSSVQITKKHAMKVLAISAYEEPLKSVILAKNRMNPATSVSLGKLIVHYTNLKHLPCDMLVPVPLHWTRYAWRGYNQAAEIAQAIGTELHKPVHTLVKRVHRTPFQSSLQFEKRHENVAEAFVLASRIDPALYAGKHLVIVDDLMTSGATLTMVAKQLLKLKPASITAVVACRVV